MLEKSVIFMKVSIKLFLFAIQLHYTFYKVINLGSNLFLCAECRALASQTFSRCTWSRDRREWPLSATVAAERPPLWSRSSKLMRSSHVTRCSELLCRFYVSLDLRLMFWTLKYWPRNRNLFIWHSAKLFHCVINFTF